MAYSKIEMGNKTTWYIEILMWAKENAIVWTSFFLAWKGLDLGFKFLKEGREAVVRRIVQEEIGKGVGIEIKQLSTDIKELGHAIFALKNRL